MSLPLAPAAADKKQSVLMLGRGRKSGLSLRRVIRRLINRSFLKSIFDGYRPEEHYMRGPGPKSSLRNAAHRSGSKSA